MQDKTTRRHFLGAAAAAGAAVASTKILPAGQQAAAPAGPISRPWIVDSHVHLRHGNAARTEYSPETIVETMDKVGIDRSVVFAICTTTTHSIEMARRPSRSTRTD